MGVRCVDDDSQVRWYPLVLQADGTWRATVSIDDFGGAMGTYAVVGALNDSAWNSHVFSSSNVQVAWEQLAGAVSAGPYDPSDGTVEVVATGVRCATGVRGVSVGVWYDADGEASSRWYALSDRGDGTWGVRVPLADLGGRSGSYSVRAALSDGSWAARLFGLARARRLGPRGQGDRLLRRGRGGGAERVEVSGGPVPRATNVAFCVVGPSGSTRWYQASRDAGGAWSASVPRADHGAGACTVGAWATVGGTTSEVARVQGERACCRQPLGRGLRGPLRPLRRHRRGRRHRRALRHGGARGALRGRLVRRRRGGILALGTPCPTAATAPGASGSPWPTSAAARAPTRCAPPSVPDRPLGGALVRPRPRRRTRSPRPR